VDAPKKQKKTKITKAVIPHKEIREVDFQVEPVTSDVVGRNPCEFTLLRETYTMVKEIKMQNRAGLNRLEAKITTLQKEILELKRNTTQIAFTCNKCK